MNRPTKEQVDAALYGAQLTEDCYPGQEDLLMDSASAARVVLAREVRALRDELATANDRLSSRGIEELVTLFIELREAAEAVEQMWCDYTSQEMYGDMLREGMAESEPSDYELWDDAHAKLRDVLAKLEPVTSVDISASEDGVLIEANWDGYSLTVTRVKT